MNFHLQSKESRIQFCSEGDFIYSLSGAWARPCITPRARVTRVQATEHRGYKSLTNYKGAHPLPGGNQAVITVIHD